MKFLFGLALFIIFSCSNKVGNNGEGAKEIYDFIKNHENKSTNKFWVIDITKDQFDDGYYYKLDFTKRVESAKTIIYTETALSHTVDSIVLLGIANEFDSKIINKVSDVYGSIPDKDNNGKIILLFYDIKDGYDGSGGFVGGFFNPADLYNQSSLSNDQSNEGEILHLDMVEQDITSFSAKSTTAHEFQHLVGYYQRHFANGGDPFSNNYLDTWISEGLAEHMEYLVYGQAALDPRIHYLENSFEPNTSLTDWGASDDRLSNYALSAAYFNFMANKMGSTAFLKQITISQNYTDHRGVGNKINSVYLKNDDLANFKASFHEFAIDGLYKVKSGIFPTTVKGNTSNLPGKFKGIKPFGSLSFKDYGFVPRFLKFGVHSSVITNGSQIVVDISTVNAISSETTNVSSIGNYNSNGYGVAYIFSQGETNVTVSTNGNFINQKFKRSTKIKEPHIQRFSPPRIRFKNN